MTAASKAPVTRPGAPLARIDGGVPAGVGRRPRFSIGVTTTRSRDGLLKETMASILEQQFGDLEVVIGNNNAAQPLQPGDLGINDPRVRVANHRENLGLLGNWQALLAQFRGDYVTWIADDDVYQPDFLSAAQAALAASVSPSACYTAYTVHAGVHGITRGPAFRGAVTVLSGLDLLRDYLTDEKPLVASMGLFSRAFAVQGLPWQALAAGDRAGEVFGEYAFVVAASRLDRVAYVPDALICLRDHAGSWGGRLADSAACERSARWLGTAAAQLLPPDLDDQERVVFMSLLGVMALRQTVSRRRNGPLEIDAARTLGAVLDSAATPGWHAGGATGAPAVDPRGWLRVLLYQSRLYAAAEIGRIEKEAALQQITAAAAERLQLVERLSDELAACRCEVATQSAAAEERLRLVEELAGELAACYREVQIQTVAANERLQLIDRLTRAVEAYRAQAPPADTAAG